MSLLPVCLWSASRAAAIACCAAPVCLWLVRFLRVSAHRSSGDVGARAVGVAAWGLLLVPFLTPDLLVGYAFGNFTPLPLVRHPWMCELLYAILLWLKLIPVGVVVLYFSPPPPLTAEAIHCRRLLSANRRLTGRSVGGLQPSVKIRLIDWLRGPSRQLLPALGLMFLLAFQEFELGALLGITAGRVGSPAMWTRTLFESQAGVIDRWAPLTWSIWPMLFNLAVLAIVIGGVVRKTALAGASSDPVTPVGRIYRVVVWIYLSAATFVVTLVPLFFVARESLAAFAAIAVGREQFAGLLREILIGCAFAGFSGLLAYVVASIPFDFRLKKQRTNRPFRSSLALLPVLPGLAGSLVVALTVLSLFQFRWFNVLYDTPLPLIIALVLFLAPRALLLQLLFGAAHQREPVRLAKLLSDVNDEHRRRTAGRLVWSLSHSRHFWATALLALWAYWDLTSTTLLHPSQLVPASVRLYNLMHYGHNAALSAMTILAVGLPVLLTFTVAAAARPLSGRFV